MSNPVRQFMLKKFPTNEYMDCPVPQHHWETIQEYADQCTAPLEARIRELEEGLRNVEIALPQQESYLDDNDTRNFYWRVIVECREHINKLLSGSGSGGYNGIKPKIICYCGSLRVAMDAFKKAEYEAVLKGEIALLPCCMFVDIEREYGAESDYKQKADDLHKWKIDISDEVFILNVNGYIGQSTRSELEYALSIGKPVKYLEPLPQPPKQ